MERREVILNFCKDAEKINVLLDTSDINKLDLKNEIRRTINTKSGDILFLVNLSKQHDLTQRLIPTERLLKSIEDMRAINEVYPNLFNYIFNGEDLYVTATLEAAKPEFQSVISRYGSVTKCYLFLMKRVLDIVKIKRKLPSTTILPSETEIELFPLSVGSINIKNNMSVVFVIPKDTYIDILKKSRDSVFEKTEMKKLDLKYWIKEINPDWEVESGRKRLVNPVPINPDFYPMCIKNIMAQKHKGNKLRFTLLRFFYSIHVPSDAKFIFLSCLSDEEREHVLNGNCKKQIEYVLNNIERYGIPSHLETRMYCDKTCTVENLTDLAYKASKQLSEDKAKKYIRQS